MFIDEAKIAVQLQHANIAQIFDLGKVDEAYFIALEYVHGRDLRGIFDDLHRHTQTMPLPQVCFVIMQVCEGWTMRTTSATPRAGAQSRPPRHLATERADWYEARSSSSTSASPRRQARHPRPRREFSKASSATCRPSRCADCPSTGAATSSPWESFSTRCSPASGCSWRERFSTLEKVRNVEIVPPSSLNAKIPEPLERIVLKALAKDVEDRYQNALDLHDDLQAFLYSVGQFSSRKDLSVWMKRTFAAGLHVDEAPRSAHRPTR